MIQTFTLVNNHQVISPILTTPREYGRWFMDTFDEYTSQLLLFKTESKDGVRTQVFHPGSRLGVFFKDLQYTDDNMRSLYIKANSPVLKKLQRFNLFESSDINRIKPEGEEQVGMWLRCYTPKQLEEYIKVNVDKKFIINEFLISPIQIVIKDGDKSSILIPKYKSNRKKLF